VDTFSHFDKGICNHSAETEIKTGGFFLYLHVNNSPVKIVTVII
jgi:hypothetical protein